MVSSAPSATPNIISAFDKVRNHFGIGRISQAGALAALNDQSYLEHVRSSVAASRDRLGAIAERYDPRHCRARLIL